MYNLKDLLKQLNCCTTYSTAVKSEMEALEILKQFHFIEENEDKKYTLTSIYKNYFHYYNFCFTSSSFERFYNKTLNSKYANQIPDMLYSLIVELKDSCKSNENPFELFCTDLMKSIYPNNSFVTTPKTCDQGIDIRGELFNNDLLLKNRPVFIQCKLHNLAKAIPVDEIRKFIGSINNQNTYSENIFITTSYFSKDAINEANSNKNTLIKLIDGVDLCEVLFKSNFCFNNSFNIDKLKKYNNLS